MNNIFSDLPQIVDMRSLDAVYLTGHYSGHYGPWFYDYDAERVDGMWIPSISLMTSNDTAKGRAFGRTVQS